MQDCLLNGRQSFYALRAIIINITISTWNQELWRVDKISLRNIIMICGLSKYLNSAIKNTCVNLRSGLLHCLIYGQISASEYSVPCPVVAVNHIGAVH